MATKPSNLASWGTDTNFSSGPESGTAVKVEPSAGAKAQGWVPGQPWRGPRMNWWQNLVHTWVQYLDDLHNSAEFLNKSYAWITGAHSFGGAVDLNGAVTCAQNLVLDGASNEVVYASPTTRTVMLPTQGIQPEVSTSLFGAEATSFLLASGTSKYGVGFRLPNGATLTSVILEARHESSPATTMSWAVSRLTWNSGVAPTYESCRAAGADSLATGTAHQQRVITCDQNNNASGSTWFVVEFTSSDTATGADPDLIRAIRYSFSDPGPRNF